jgi:hypothetical protein
MSYEKRKVEVRLKNAVGCPVLGGKYKGGAGGFVTVGVKVVAKLAAGACASTVPPRVVSAIRRA